MGEVCRAFPPGGGGPSEWEQHRGSHLPHGGDSERACFDRWRVDSAVGASGSTGDAGCEPTEGTAGSMPTGEQYEPRSTKSSIQEGGAAESQGTEKKGGQGRAASEAEEGRRGGAAGYDDKRFSRANSGASRPTLCK